jgi:hypothetical protein
MHFNGWLHVQATMPAGVGISFSGRSMAQPAWRAKRLRVH